MVHHIESEIGPLGNPQRESGIPLGGIRQKAKTGETLWEWADIDDAPRVHVVKSVQQERRSIASDCYALVMKVDHYNAAHIDEEPIQIVMDFEEDVEEMKIASGLSEDDEAA